MQQGRESTDADKDDADGCAHGSVVLHQHCPLPRQQAVAAARKPLRAAHTARTRRLGAARTSARSAAICPNPNSSPIRRAARRHVSLSMPSRAGHAVLSVSGAAIAGGRYGGGSGGGAWAGGGQVAVQLAAQKASLGLCRHSIAFLKTHPGILHGCQHMYLYKWGRAFLRVRPDTPQGQSQTCPHARPDLSIVDSKSEQRVSTRTDRHV